jgi:very-short-patch-repair endonuclease
MRSIRSRKRKARRRRPPRPVSYRPRRYLLTKNETAFFQILSALVPECYRISCKVRLADLVTADRDGNFSHANRISQKHVDFVVSDAESSRIVAAIELDDASHELPDRRARDAFVNRLFWQIGVRLIRVPAQWQYDGNRVADQLTKAGLLVKRQIRHVDGDVTERTGIKMKSPIVDPSASPSHRKFIR